MYLKTNEKQRVFVCGDLHGMHDLLITALNKVNFKFGIDVLVCVGDLIDRGPDSQKVLDLFIDTPNFYTVLGNHEDMALSSDKRLHKYNGGKFFYNLSLQDQVKYKQWFRTLPITITIETPFSRYGVVHANVPAEITEWDKVVELSSGTLKQNLIWSREIISCPESYVDSIIEGVETVFLGHTILDDGPILIGNRQYIDTGSFYWGKLTLVELTHNGDIFTTVCKY